MSAWPQVRRKIIERKAAQMKGKRPVQIQIEEEKWKILQVWAASRGTSANEIIAKMAEDKAEKVREKVAPLLD